MISLQIFLQFQITAVELVSRYVSILSLSFFLVLLTRVNIVTRPSNFTALSSSSQCKSFTLYFIYATLIKLHEPLFVPEDLHEYVWTCYFHSDQLHCPHTYCKRCGLDYVPSFIFLGHLHVSGPKWSRKPSISMK